MLNYLIYRFICYLFSYLFIAAFIMVFELSMWPFFNFFYLFVVIYTFISFFLSFSSLFCLSLSSFPSLCYLFIFYFRHLNFLAWIYVYLLSLICSFVRFPYFSFVLQYFIIHSFLSYVRIIIDKLHLFSLHPSAGVFDQR